MSVDGPSIPSRSVPFEGATPPTPAAPGWTWLALLAGAAGLSTSVMLWNKVSSMQEQLAQQSAQATTQALEARALAKESQDLVQATTTRLSVAEARLAEVSLHRGQLEELVHSLSRSREDTLALDLEAAMRLSVQQAQLTGSTEPLIASLKSASKRIERSAQPSLAAAQRAMERDLERLRQSPSPHTASLLARLDEVLRQIDELPLHSGAPLPHEDTQPSRHATGPDNLNTDTDHNASAWQWAWWQARGQQLWGSIRSEAGELLRVSYIDQPEAALLSPEQSFFLRENLKLQLLSARLALLARQYDAARADLSSAQASIGKYFDPQGRNTHKAQASLALLHEQLGNIQQPNLEDTLTALASASARLE